VIVAAVGDVTLTDVERASLAGDAVVLAFNVKMGKCLKWIVVDSAVDPCLEIKIHYFSYLR
jgi:translation initiation factor IF-2